MYVVLWIIETIASAASSHILVLPMPIPLAPAVTGASRFEICPQWSLCACHVTTLPVLSFCAKQHKRFCHHKHVLFGGIRPLSSIWVFFRLVSLLSEAV